MPIMKLEHILIDPSFSGCFRQIVFGVENCSGCFPIVQFFSLFYVLKADVSFSVLKGMKCVVEGYPQVI